MSEVTMEVKVKGIAGKVIYEELSKKDYSEEILIRPCSFSIIFDRAEDLVRFFEFVKNYSKETIKTTSQ